MEATLYITRLLPDIMDKVTTMVVIVALTQAVLLSAAVTALVSLIPSAQAQKTFNCSGGSGGVNPHGNIRCDPHDVGGGAPPLPSCSSPNRFKNSDACR
jgi:hypothetical protein